MVKLMACVICGDREGWTCLSSYILVTKSLEILIHRKRCLLYLFRVVYL